MGSKTSNPPGINPDRKFTPEEIERIHRSNMSRPTTAKEWTDISKELAVVAIYEALETPASSSLDPSSSFDAGGGSSGGGGASGGF